MARSELLPELLPEPLRRPTPADDKGPVTHVTAGHGPFFRRRMGDSNPRGCYPNTLSKRAP